MKKVWKLFEGISYIDIFLTVPNILLKMYIFQINQHTVYYFF